MPLFHAFPSERPDRQLKGYKVFSRDPFSKRPLRPPEWQALDLTESDDPRSPGQSLFPGALDGGPLRPPVW